jgi:hypothetical protein
LIIDPQRQDGFSSQIPTIEDDNVLVGIVLPEAFLGRFTALLPGELFKVMRAEEKIWNRRL